MAAQVFVPAIGRIILGSAVGTLLRGLFGGGGTGGFARFRAAFTTTALAPRVSEVGTGRSIEPQFVPVLPLPRAPRRTRGGGPPPPPPPTSYYPFYPPASPGRVSYPPGYQCTTDSDCEAYEKWLRAAPILYDPYGVIGAFVPNIPVQIPRGTPAPPVGLPPGVLEPRIPGTRPFPGGGSPTRPRLPVLPGIGGFIVRGVLGTIGAILWPGTLGDADLDLPPMVPRKGPRTRPRVFDFPDTDPFPQPVPMPEPGDRPQPQPDVRPEPLPQPVLRPQPFPTPGTRPSTRPGTRPAPRPGTRPTTSPRPFALPFLPLAFPFPVPLPSGVPTPRMPPIRDPLSLMPPPQPLPGFLDLPGLTQFPEPLAFSQPQARPGNCPPCPEAKKPKPRKKRQPRSVCYKGSYMERRFGTSKRPREKIPCQ